MLPKEIISFVRWRRIFLHLPVEEMFLIDLL